MTEKTHSAVVTVTPGGPLQILQVPTPTPINNEVRILTLWTSSTPLDLHQNDGHLLVTPPQILGDTIAGRIVEVGPDVKHLVVGDNVFGFTWRTAKEKAHQEFVVVPENLVGKIPDGFSMREVVTVPDNFITILNAVVADFGMELPWPKPDGWVPSEGKDEGVLVWGGSSSTGMYALQILKWLGYTRLIAVASAKHHERLRRYGASHCIDYRGGTDQAVEQIDRLQSEMGRPIRYILDCIGSVEGSVRPVAKVARKGSTVAVLLPVIVKDSAEGVKPEYSFDVEGLADWAEGVMTRGVRTHFYLDYPLLAEKGQSEMMPKALELGIIEPNEQLIVEGSTLLERAEKAMTMLRSKAVSGQRLVWRVADESQV